MNYLDVIVKGFFSENTREYFIDYLSREFKKAEEDGYRAAEFFNGCNKVALAFEKDLQDQLHKRKNELYLMRSEAKAKTLKFGEEDISKTLEQRFEETIEYCNSELEEIGLDYFTINLSSITNGKIIGNMPNSEVVILKESIQSAYDNALSKEISQNQKVESKPIEEPSVWDKFNAFIDLCEMTVAPIIPKAVGKREELYRAVRIVELLDLSEALNLESELTKLWLESDEHKQWQLESHFGSEIEFKFHLINEYFDSQSPKNLDEIIFDRIKAVHMRLLGDIHNFRAKCILPKQRERFVKNVEKNFDGLKRWFETAIQNSQNSERLIQQEIEDYEWLFFPEKRNGTLPPKKWRSYTYSGYSDLYTELITKGKYKNCVVVAGKIRMGNSEFHNENVVAWSQYLEWLQTLPVLRKKGNIKTIELKDFFIKEFEPEKIEAIQKRFADSKGKELAIIIYLLHCDFKVIHLANRSNKSRTNFIRALTKNAIDRTAAIDKHFVSNTNNTNVSELDEQRILLRTELETLLGS